MKAALRDLLREGSPDQKSDLVRLWVWRVVEEELEAAAKDLLERGYYELRAPEGEGYRNGWREGRLKTSEGEVGYAVPRVRDICAEPITRMRQALSGKTDELERLMVEIFARGCSYRDIGDTISWRRPSESSQPSGTDAGDRGAVEGVRRARGGDLSEVRPLHLFVDGLAEELRVGSPREEGVDGLLP